MNEGCNQPTFIFMLLLLASLSLVIWLDAPPPMTEESFAPDQVHEIIVRKQGKVIKEVVIIHGDHPYQTLIVK